MKKLLLLIVVAVVFALSIAPAFAAKPVVDTSIIDGGTFDLPKIFEKTVPPPID